MPISRYAAKKAAPAKPMPTKAVASKKVGLKPPKAKALSYKVIPYRYDSDGQHGFTIEGTPSRRIFTFVPEVDSTNISCGVYQLAGLPGNVQFTAVDNLLGSAAATDKLITSHIVQTLDDVKNNAESGDGAAFLLLSNYITDGSSRINNILEKICATTEARRNPNSGNNIRVYIY